MAAVIGGTQSLHTNSLDEALALPSEEAVEIALRTQQIIAYESGLTNTIDPLAGSYFVENLTNQMEEEVEEYIKKVEQLGGVIPAIEKGFFQQEIANAAYRYQKEIEKNQRVIVGVNKFTKDEKIEIPLLKIGEEIAERQKSRLEDVKSKRDSNRVDSALKKIKQVAATNENIFPYILEAVKTYATIGEICDVLREVFGEWKGDLLF